MASVPMLTSDRKVGGGARTLGRLFSEGEGCRVRTTRAQAAVVWDTLDQPTVGEEPSQDVENLTTGGGERRVGSKAPFVFLFFFFSFVLIQIFSFSS
jgi:hypothetical protein